MSQEQVDLPPELNTIQSEIESLISSGTIDVPMLPEVASKALLLAQNPDSDASEMANLIQSDQSLAGHVMRIANSAAYTPLSNLVSLQQAIARLGMRVISEIALTAAIGAKLFKTPGFEPYVATVWKQALSTSLWAKEVARHCRSNVEVSFLAGLLNTIGKPASLQVILDLSQKAQLTLSSDEVHTLESYYWHAISNAVVTEWKMPKLVVDAIGYTDSNDTESTAAKTAAIVTLSEQLAQYMLDEADNMDVLLTSPALVTLNIYQDEVEQLVSKLDDVKLRLQGLSS
jgi:HD-like signal output (HDOD) protein